MATAETAAIPQPRRVPADPLGVPRPLPQPRSVPAGPQQATVTDTVIDAAKPRRVPATISVYGSNGAGREPGKPDPGRD